MFNIQYLAPYSRTVRTQSFSSLEEALRMIAFYASCGTVARIV
jgi:hypothetical protein